MLGSLYHWNQKPDKRPIIPPNGPIRSLRNRLGRFLQCIIVWFVLYEGHHQVFERIVG